MLILVILLWIKIEKGIKKKTTKTVPSRLYSVSCFSNFFVTLPLFSGRVVQVSECVEEKTQMSPSEPDLSGP